MTSVYEKVVSRRAATLYGEPVNMGKFAGEIERQAKTKKDFVVGTDNLRMDISGEEPELRFPGTDGGEMAFKIRPFCHTQIGLKTGIPKPYYERMLDQNLELLAENVNAWMNTKEKRMVRTLDGYARALVSDRFRALDNADLFFGAVQAFDKVNAQVIQADLSETRLYIRAVRPDMTAEIKTGDDICSGVVLSNSEVGAGMLRIEEFCYRLVCSNGAIGQTIFDRAHLGQKLEVGIYTEETISKTSEALWLQVRDNIASAFSRERLETWKSRYTGAMLVELPPVTKLVEGSWTGFGVSDEEKSAILKNLIDNGEGLTQFGLSQAVTATANGIMDADRVTDLQRLGFNLGVMEKDDFEHTMQQVVKTKRKVMRIDG